MDKYQRGKIYKIRNDIDNDIYVGSTCEKLNRRLHDHLSNARTRYEGRSLHEKINILGEEHIFIELIEEYPCNSKKELRLREEFWKNELGATLNMVACGRDINEGLGIDEYRRQYRQLTKDHRKNWWKEYEKINGARLNARKAEKITCACGCQVSRGHISKHLKTKKHLDIIGQN